MKSFVNEPVVSVVIPTFNTTAPLMAMIRCMFRQTYRNWELIIVDDCSTDHSFADIQAQIADPRIRLIKRDKSTKGSTVCRNIGFDLSKGRYVLHLDADDLISSDCIENRVLYMDEHPELDFAIFRGKSFADDDKQLNSKLQKNWGTRKGNVIIDFLRGQYPFSIWNLIFRRKSIESFCWNENVKIYTDFSYIIPILLADLKYEFANNQEYDYFYRVGQHRNNMCANYVSDEKCASTLYLFNQVLFMLKNADKKNYQVYKSAFKGSLEWHFVRLVLSSNYKEIASFLAFVKQYYKYTYYYKLLIFSKIALLENNMNIKKIGIYLLEVLFFCKFDSFKYQIRKIKFRLLDN